MMMDHGKSVEIAGPDSIFTHPSHPRTAEFLQRVLR
jgi:ABC-type oligopeptide transport system ATPase subunit